MRPIVVGWNDHNRRKCLGRLGDGGEPGRGVVIQDLVDDGADGTSSRQLVVVVVVAAGGCVRGLGLEDLICWAGSGLRGYKKRALTAN
jgi:hypothetical protein